MKIPSYSNNFIIRIKKMNTHTLCFCLLKESYRHCKSGAGSVKSTEKAEDIQLYLAGQMDGWMDG